MPRNPEIHNSEKLDPEDAALLATPIPTEIEKWQRREYALAAVDAMSNILEIPVSVPNLIALADETEATPVRLQAKRALRCIESVSRENSAIINAIGETGLYPYVEGVMTYGASNNTYLRLMKDYQLSASEATALYALREQVREYTIGTGVGFDQLLAALQSIHISPQEAALDTDAAMEALDAAGYFMDNVGGVTFNRPIFSPRIARQRLPLGKDPDTYYRPEADAWLREQFEGRHGLPGEELGS